MRSVSKNNLSLKILHTNIRGYNSKRISLETIVKTNDIDIVTINETHLKGKKKAEIPGFESFSRNRTHASYGGIATCVKNTHAKDTLLMYKGSEDNEIVITRHNQFKVAINVVNIYGCQENRSNKEKIDENWNIILQEISKIEARGEFVCLIGDFNRKVGNLVPGNNTEKESYGGSLIRQRL